MSTKDRCCTTGEPRPRHNDPGKDAIDARVDVWAGFRQRMVDALSTQFTPPDGDPATAPRPLRDLTSRDPSDGTLALIDAWAVACDVLAFYQERAVNETYLRTATERRSVVEIARMVGYDPAPGVAASTRLAFEIDATDRAPEVVSLAAGLVVMSVPGQDELPQTWETLEDIEARAPWNAMVPRQTLPPRLEGSATSAWLAGVATRLEPGHTLLFLGDRQASPTSSEHCVVTVTAVEPERENDRTRVHFTPALPAGAGSWTSPAVLTFRQRAGIFGWNAPDYRAMNVELKANFDPDELVFVNDLKVLAKENTDVGAKIAVPYLKDRTWDRMVLGSDAAFGATAIDLDRETDKAPPQSWVVVQHESEDAVPARVESNTMASRRDWTLIGKVSRLTLDTVAGMANFDRRATAVLHQSEALALAAPPDLSDVAHRTLEVEPEVPAMEEGRVLLVTATSAVSGAPVVHEVAVHEVTSDGGGTSVITLIEDLPEALVRSSVVVYGNTAEATHGESVAEQVLGHGDARVPNLRVRLPQKPLTWVAAATASGAEATLELRVGGVRWDRVDSLYDAGPSDRVYALDLLEDGTTEVVFGDGLRGARPPTGTGNITGVWRVGLGLAGEVDAGQLTLLRTRPLGLKGATNPGRGSGAADAESIDEARINAPRTVTTLDRLVALADYEHFARGFAGIGKVLARELWDGRRAFVHLTVAAANGTAFDPSDPTLEALEQAIRTYRDPTQLHRTDPHIEVRFGVRLALATDPAWVREDVEQAVHDAIVDGMSFASRTFGQPVTRAELAARIQGVGGVVASDIDALFRIGEAEQPNEVLRANLARWTGGAVERAELLLVDPDAIVIEGMSP